ncbi:hypothetical protein [Phycicoccus sp. Soil803]|uniref:hypothetical protein n=1 Tax=Phycicoccus sp. Soil803 TaxID=1736415 RepID=UPI00071089DD|nr:hypothetical protein [Phycicoccus sp. Soil803]KRF23571.1 hypothetical protein ASG95_02460 [Phycicoccus sp. Soil803]
MKQLLRERWRLVAMAGALAVLLLLGLLLQLLSPRTTGVAGDWSAKTVDGAVVAGRAVVSDDHTALDLRSGKTVTLGSVRGGVAYVADDRLVIASPGQVDSVGLDATARWTWRAAAGETVSPVAAGRGGTVVLACPTKGPCRLVGLDPRGNESWSSKGVERRDPLPAGPLPRVDATSAGGGVLVTDPASGRAALQPGRSFVALPDGPVVTEVVQDGKCVIAAYASADPAWTRVLPRCPAAETPRLSADPTDPAVVTVTWPSTTARLDLATGRPASPTPRSRGTVVARGDGLTATTSRKSLHTNPFRWGRRVTLLQLVDDRSGDVRAQVVSDHSLALLHLDGSSVVVRDGDEVIRYLL